eukprot:2363984-Amphidinium_carterae.1
MKNKSLKHTESELILNGIGVLCTLCGDMLVVASAQRGARREENLADLGVERTKKPVKANPLPVIERTIFAEGQSSTGSDMCVVCLQEFKVGDELGHCCASHRHEPQWEPHPRRTLTALSVFAQ